jgi:mycoredoxin
MSAEQAVVIYGTAWCGDCRLAKRLLDDHAVPYRWVDIDGDAAGEELVLRLGGGRRIVPTILLPDGQVLTEPTGSALLIALRRAGLTGPTDESRAEDGPCDQP